MKQTILFAVFILLLAGAILYINNNLESKKPLNVLLITIDTLRADHLGMYGYSRNTSPALDRFAAEAAVFENAYCVMPTTIPSHASLLFGTWPRIHGSTSNHVLISNQSLQFMPVLFRREGYRTAASVSADHLAKRFKGFGGFEKMDYPYEHERTCDVTLSAARAWLRLHHKEKYFLWIHLWDPHSPYKLHPEFMRRIHADFQDDFKHKHGFHEPGFYTEAHLQRMIDLYDNEIAYTDYHLGKFVEELQTKGALDNTMVVVLSDHGESLTELVRNYGYAFDHGEFLFDHQIRIPLIIRMPKAAARRTQNVVSIIDIMPTILKAAGLTVPPTVMGKSFLPLLYSPETTVPSPFVFVQRRSFEKAPRPYLSDPQFAVRDRTYKLFYNGTTGKVGLYRNDREDRIVTDARASGLLERQLKQWLESTEKFAHRKQEFVSEEESEKLRSLGYVQ